MTFYIIGAYTFTVNLTLSVKDILKKQNFDYIGIILGSLLLILGFILIILLMKKK